MKKKAFTLTELLVVVVIIGVLSAVVLPKFSKVIESRRTAEAESVMRAVRNEQEMRCTLDKNYTTNKENLAVWPKRESANYTYALNEGGISATRKDKDYTLEIKTYLDGGICCRGSYCSSLNKDYPLCEDYQATPNTKDCVPYGVKPEPEPVCSLRDYEEDCPDGQDGKIIYTVKSDCTGYDVENTCQGSYCEPGKPGWNNWIGQAISCEQPHAGNVEGTWNTSTCKCDCPENAPLADSGECEPKPVCDESFRQDCEMGGQDAYIYAHWTAGNWSDEQCKCKCPLGYYLKQGAGCVAGCSTDEFEQRDRCMWNRGENSQEENWVKGSWNENKCQCTCPAGARFFMNVGCVADAQTCQDSVDKRAEGYRCVRDHNAEWNDDTCECSCAAGYTWNGARCVTSCEATMGLSASVVAELRRRCENMNLNAPTGYYPSLGKWSEADCSCRCGAGHSYKQGYCYEGAGPDVAGTGSDDHDADYGLEEDFEFPERFFHEYDYTPDDDGGDYDGGDQGDWDLGMDY